MARGNLTFKSLLKDRKHVMQDFKEEMKVILVSWQFLLHPDGN